MYSHFVVLVHSRSLVKSIDRSKDLLMSGKSKIFTLPWPTGYTAYMLLTRTCLIDGLRTRKMKG